MKFDRYEVKLDRNNNYTLIVYLDSYLTEFSDELDQLQVEQQDLQRNIRKLIKSKFPHIPIKTAKIMAGSLIVTTLYFYSTPAFQNQRTVSAQTLQEVQPDTYTVASGDTLSLIGKKFNVSVASIKTLNNLTSDTIFIGQTLKLPYFTYTVVSGDSLSVIAKRYNTTTEHIASFNELTSYTINIGQKLKVPLNQSTPVQETVKTSVETNPTEHTYTVVSGDTLSLIAKKYNTTVESIRSLNNLTTDMIFVGQVLVVSETQQNEPVQETTVTPDPMPTENLTTYTVVAGDSLSLIAKKFNTTVTAIKEANNLTSDFIYIGQTLTIPAFAQQEVKDTIAPPVPILNVTNVITKQNQSNITLSGSTETNATLNVIITDQNQKSLSFVLNADDNGQFQKQLDVLMLADGNLTVTAIATDPAGNRSSESQVTLKKDTVSTAPTITSTDIYQANAAAYAVTGTADAGSIVTIIVSDGQQETSTQTVATENGNFQTYINVSQLKDGNITISIKAIDSLKNESNITTKVVTKDTVSATPTIETIPFINSEASTNVVINGTSEANTTILIRATDGVNEARGEVKTDEAGYYQGTLNVATLNDGPITVTSISIDTFGNKSKEATQIVSKDTKIEELIINRMDAITPQNASQYQISGQTEANALVNIQIIDEQNQSLTQEIKADVNGRFQGSVDLLSLDDGQLTITAHSIDEVKNRSSEYQGTIIKDTHVKPPELEVPTYINKDNQTNVLISGSALPASTVLLTFLNEANEEITVDTTTNANGTYTVVVDLSTLQDKEITVSAMQTSIAGIQSEVIEKQMVKDVDIPLSPTLHNNYFINRENQHAYLLSGNAEPNARITIKVGQQDGQAFNLDTSADSSGEYSIPVDLSTFNDGDISFSLTQTDTAGNKSEMVSKTLVKDTIASTTLELDQLRTIFSGNVYNYTLSGTADPHTTLTILLFDGENTITKTIEANEEGFFETVVDMSTLNDGQIQASFQSKDAAGNVGEPYSVTAMKDTSAPAEAAVTVPPYINQKNMSTYELTGASVEEGSNVHIAASDGTKTIEGTALVINGSFQTELDLSTLEDGVISIEITQTDRAGNQSVVQASTIEKDTVITEPIISKNGFRYENLQSIYTLIGTAEPNATIEVTIFGENGENLLTTSSEANTNGYYSTSMYLDVLKAKGNVTLSVTQTDLAGNTSEMNTTSLQTYTVSSGETLDAIAKRFHTSVAALTSLNQLSSHVVQPNQQLLLPISASEIMNLGYMYFGHTRDYLHMVNQTAHSVNVVAPSYFDINTDGTLKLTYQVDPSFITMMHEQGKRVVPFLSNHWDRALGRAMLANKEQAAQQIADAIERYDLDGVNVDIENVTEADRQDYTEFVRLLREKIPATKEVSVAVAANPNGWTTGWHGSYDYTELAKYSDYLMIMSYDESYPGGEAGSVASYNWVERSVQYALNQNVSSDKIVLGVAHFGRYWMEGASYGGHGISNSQVQTMIERYNGVVTFDELSKTPKATITIREGDPVTVIGGSPLSPGTYEIWFENEESISHKLSLINQYNLRGVGNWSIGQENTEVWKTYATSLAQTLAVTTPVVTQNYMEYRVVAGDTLWAIAQRHNTTIQMIKDINQLTSDSLSIGQILKLPQNQQEPAVTEVTASPSNTYEVVSGDSLSLIANKFNTTVLAIKEENQLTSDMIYVGQVLVIPSV